MRRKNVTPQHGNIYIVHSPVRLDQHVIEHLEPEARKLASTPSMVHFGSTYLYTSSCGKNRLKAVIMLRGDTRLQFDIAF